VLKQRCNSGYDTNLYFFRDNNGSVIDLLCKTRNGLVGIEIQAAFAPHGKLAKQHVRFAANNHPLNQSLVVYKGVYLQPGNGVNAISYDRLVPARQFEQVVLGVLVWTVVRICSACLIKFK